MSSKAKQIERLRARLQDTEAELGRMRGAEPTGRQTVVLRERKLSTFSGKKRECVEDWLEDIKRAVARRGTTEEQVDFILEHLSGDALEEVRHRCRLDITTVGEIYDTLCNAFGAGNKSKASLERHFYNRIQQNGESLRQYSHALMTLVERITTDKTIRNTMLIEQFAENVRSKALKRELKLICRREDISFVQLREDAIAWAGEDCYSDDGECSVTIKQVTKHEQVDDVRKLLRDSLALTEKLADRITKLEEVQPATTSSTPPPPQDFLPSPPFPHPVPRNPAGTYFPSTPEYPNASTNVHCTANQNLNSYPPFSSPATWWNVEASSSLQENFHPPQ